MTIFPITALRSVDIELADIGAAAEFYTGIWGLEETARDGDTVWLRGAGSDAQLLALHRGDASRIRSMTFRVAPHADLMVLRERATQAGCIPVHDYRSLDEPGEGDAVSIRDPQGRTIRLVQGDFASAPLATDRDRPERLAHVNINSDDPDRDAALFVDGLGFALTDRSKMMAFVRTNEDHHSVVIAQAPVNTLNHIAFQLAGWEDVMRASGRMVDAGFPIAWGPGRHGPGNNVFSYFLDPFGFVIEYTADVLQVDDEYRVGGPDDWIWPAGRTDQWGIAPPKTEACKLAQLAIPFTGPPL